MKKVDFLRKKYPQFVYQNYSYKIVRGNLKISFLFEVPPDIRFKPEITIKNVTRSVLVKKITGNALDNLVFHLGLIEIPSYWKATCSPKIIIKAGSLDKNQIKWWKELIIKGMGQFFYENKINFTQSNFLKIKSDSSNFTNQAMTEFVRLKEKNKKFLVPVGGGKDSIVTLEKLKERREKIGYFLVNPTKVMRKIVRVTGIKDSVIVKREIDPALLKLNKRGYLNGHTPITAVISFLSVISAVLFNYKNIAFSNEKSANEGNVRYLGKIINHQWAKSSEFEIMFKKYCKEYLARNINYFSYLRKYGEIEIARMLVKYQKYFPVFSSCNVVVAKKLKKKWCGNCSKCLFVYATLYPFLGKKQLLKIFGRDIFENKKLLPTMRQLIGERGFKPFECVGTKKESKLVFRLSLKKAIKEGEIPFLLTKIK